MAVSVHYTDASVWECSLRTLTQALGRLHPLDDVRERIIAYMALHEEDHPSNAAKAWLLARLLVLQMVATYLKHTSSVRSYALEKILIARTPFGRPVVPQMPELCVSASHSGPYACSTISVDGFIGIDVVNVQSVSVKDMRSAFVLSEWKFMELVQEVPQEVVFAVYWALKESILKAFGFGLLSSTCGMQDIELDPIDFLSLVQKNMIRFPLCPPFVTELQSLPLRVHGGVHNSFNYFIVFLTRGVPNELHASTVIGGVTLSSSVKTVSLTWIAPEAVVGSTTEEI